MRSSSTRVTDPYKDKQYAEQVQGVMRAFREYHTWLMDSVIIKHLQLEKLTAVSDVMNTSIDSSLDTLTVPGSPDLAAGEGKSKTLSECLDPRKAKEIALGMPYQYRKFMEIFLITQQFNVYTEKLLEIMQKPAPAPTSPQPTAHTPLGHSPSFGRISQMKQEVRTHVRRSSFGDLASYLISGKKT